MNIFRIMFRFRSDMIASASKTHQADIKAVVELNKGVLAEKINFVEVWAG